MLSGNEHIKSLIANMIQKGREPHSLIITGEHGQGRKTAAKYIAAAMLCEKQTGVPCGECKSCRMIKKGIHPDFIEAQANENGNYPVDSIRAMVSDAVVSPNEGRVKVYLIADFDKSKITGEQVQNILLKLIEEPPDHVVIILTADSREAFLQTILSRAVCMSVSPCTPEECAAYLGTLEKYEYGDITQAVEALGGNIGNCIEYLEKGLVYSAVYGAREITKALVSGSEYELLKAINSCDGKKGQLRETLVRLSDILRDSTVAAMTDSLVGCYHKGAKEMNEKYGAGRCERYYRAVSEYITRIDRNCSKTLVINSLCARLAQM